MFKFTKGKQGLASPKRHRTDSERPGGLYSAPYSQVLQQGEPFVAIERFHPEVWGNPLSLGEDQGSSHRICQAQAGRGRGGGVILLPVW